MTAKTGRVLLSMIFGLLLAGLLQADEQTPDSVAKIDVSSASKVAAAEDNTIIIDVRTPAEYDQSHIPDALNLNVQDDAFVEMLETLDRDNRYIVHCTKNPADGRSSSALEIMQEMGFRKLLSLEGGYIAWQDAQLPLVETAE